MRLTVREVATLLNSPEETVYRWIESGEMPAYRIQDQYRVNRSELLEWATARKIPVAPELFHEANGESPIRPQARVSSEAESSPTFEGRRAPRSCARPCSISA